LRENFAINGRGECQTLKGKGEGADSDPGLKSRDEGNTNTKEGGVDMYWGERNETCIL